MTLNRFVDLAFVIGVLVSLLAAGALWVSAQDDSQGAEGADVGPRKVCQTPPSPSLSMGTSSGSKDNYRTKNVSVSGTYGARVRTVAERGGEEFCYSSWDSASLTISVSEGSSRRIYARWDDVSLREHYIDYEFEWTTKPKPTATPTRDPCQGCQTPTPEPTDTPTPVPPTATPAPTPPGTPSWSAYAHASINSITPRWNAPTAGTNAIDGYDLRYRVDGTGTWSVRSDVSTRTISGDIATTVSSLSSDTEYEVQVRAFDTAGNRGSWSGIKHIRTVKPSPTPVTPTPTPTPVGPPASPSFTATVEVQLIDPVYPPGSFTSIPDMDTGWKVASYGKAMMKVTSPAGQPDLTGYQFQLFTNAPDTGFQVGTDKCDFSGRNDLSGFVTPASADSYTLEVDIVRCAVGNPPGSTTSGSKFAVWGLNGNNVWTVARTDPIEQAWHHADHDAIYDLSVIPLAGNPPPRRPGEVLLPNNWLADTETAVRDAASTWTNLSLGVSVVEGSSSPNVMVRGYYGSDASAGCGTGVIACVHSFRTGHPHYEAQVMTLWIPDKPPGRGWTNNFKKASNRFTRDDYYYLPRTMMHEFGHTIGLGHTERSQVYSIMGGYEPLQAPLPYDENAVKGIYKNHTRH